MEPSYKWPCFHPCQYHAYYNRIPELVNGTDVITHLQFLVFAAYGNALNTQAAMETTNALWTIVYCYFRKDLEHIVGMTLDCLITLVNWPPGPHETKVDDAQDPKTFQSTAPSGMIQPATALLFLKES